MVFLWPFLSKNIAILGDFLAKFGFEVFLGSEHFWSYVFLGYMLEVFRDYS